jgi:hypothetical protein
MREFTDSTGARWEAFPREEPVAHLRAGARLAFRPAGEEGSVVTSAVTFNTVEAAEQAIRSMSDGELVRRLVLARKESGVRA